MRYILALLISLFGISLIAQTDTARAGQSSRAAAGNVQPTMMQTHTARTVGTASPDPEKSQSAMMQAGSKQAFADTVPVPNIELSADTSANYIRSLLSAPSLWRTETDTLRHALERLLYQYTIPYSNIEQQLNSFPFDSVQVIDTILCSNDTVNLHWLNDSTMYLDPGYGLFNPLQTERTIIFKTLDTAGIVYLDSLAMPDTMESYPRQRRNRSDTLIQVSPYLQLKALIDSISQERDSLVNQRGLIILNIDTISTVTIDTAALAERNITLYRVKDSTVIPAPTWKQKALPYAFSSEWQYIIFTDSARVRLGSPRSPFYKIPGERMTDSLQRAVATLASYIYERDSVQIFIRDMNGRKTPFWLSAENEDLYRIWIKNYRNDSITVWMGNPEKFDITLFLEEEIQIDRPEKQPVEKIPVPNPIPESKLAGIEPLEIIPVYWDHDLSTLFSFNQTYLSNWAKGGESSISTLLDIKGSIQYNNKESKTKWINNGRLKYGSIFTPGNGLRTNTDQLEINSQYNRVINKEIDFSTALYFKTQVAPGFTYPNDSTQNLVSKFLNPGTFTLGVGVEYKPIKKTVLNFSPISYKNTFVLDTVNIDQTNHGVETGSRARQELGGQLVAKNSMTLLEGLDMTNSLRLFTNYFSKPINMDVDWEFNLEKRINWYFTIGVNLHLIYDKDVKFPVFDDGGEPVLGPDNNPLKEPKVQFKEFIGLNFSFTF